MMLIYGELICVYILFYYIELSLLQLLKIFLEKFNTHTK